MLQVIFLLCLFLAGNAWAESIEQLKMNAEQGDSVAQYNLGLKHARGKGIDQNFIEAFKWYRLAAEQGNSTAQYALGVAYLAGEGVVQDYRQVHMWFNIAAANGDEEAGQIRDDIAKEMSSEDLSKAQDMAREWVKNH